MRISSVVSKVEPEPGAGAGPLHRLRPKSTGSGSATLLSTVIHIVYYRYRGICLLLFSWTDLIGHAGEVQVEPLDLLVKGAKEQVVPARVDGQRGDPLGPRHQLLSQLLEQQSKCTISRS